MTAIIFRRSAIVLVAALLAGTAQAAERSTSIYATAPADPRAVTVVARGDGTTDDGAAIQAAIDRVAAQGGGGIVFLPDLCADAGARAAGCQPINIFGGATPSAAALDYVTPDNGPFQHTKLTQDVASLAFSGEPLNLQAGPLAVAFGGEYRREFYCVNADPYGAGVTPLSPNSAAYPADPLLNSTLGSNWAAGNYKNGRGKYDVYEGFFELNLPLWKSDELGSANVNVAGRGTHYSTSGTVWAWKVGGTWETPLDGIRLRAVTSRDVRAPNLSELFAAPTVTTLRNFNNPLRNQAVQAFLDHNRMKGAFYLDLGGSVTITKAVGLFFKVDNVLDHDPAPSPQTNTGLDVNPALYDTLGRIYRVGVRAKF